MILALTCLTSELNFMGSHVICFYYILHYIASCLFCVQHSRQTVPALWGTRAQQRWASSSRLPMNTVVLFVPQQEAWVVERMGRFHRILEPVSYPYEYLQCILIITSH